MASLSTFYWRSNEESVEGDRPQKAPVLESRETVYASNSRADPVQGMSMRETFVTKILSFFIQPNAANKTDSMLTIKPVTLLLITLLAWLTTSGWLENSTINTNNKLKCGSATSSSRDKTKLEKIKEMSNKRNQNNCKNNGNTNSSCGTQQHQRFEDKLRTLAISKEITFCKSTTTTTSQPMNFIIDCMMIIMAAQTLVMMWLNKIPKARNPLAVVVGQTTMARATLEKLSTILSAATLASSIENYERKKVMATFETTSVSGKTFTNTNTASMFVLLPKITTTTLSNAATVSKTATELNLSHSALNSATATSSNPRVQFCTLR